MATWKALELIAMATDSTLQPKSIRKWLTALWTQVRVSYQLSGMRQSDSGEGEASIQGYWRVFGGPISIVRSTYFWVAFVLTVALPQMRLKEVDQALVWPQFTLDIAPSLLGFATGGMAIMLAFSSGRFLKAIQQGGKDKSYLRKVIATFYHFALVSTMAIISAYVSKFYPHPWLSFAGVFLTLYAILLVMSIVSRLWHTARIFNKVTENDNASPSPPSPPRG